MKTSNSEVPKFRGSNFSAAEKESALACIESYRSVVECKKTDSISAKEKEEAWSLISNHFNALPHVSKRSAKQLRLWWDNQKKRSRSRMADHKVTHCALPL
jgi:hypothetical protein